MQGGLTRRGFLLRTGVGAVTLTLGGLTFGCTSEPERAAVPATPTVGPAELAGAHGPVPEYREWEDLFRARWTWDSVAKGTHHVNCWYQRGCNWNVYVKDGIVFREEQVAAYPRTNETVPDYNPRGCQKGGSYSRRMYDPGRLKYPLKRMGERGQGKWQRVSWEEALNDIADRMIDVMRKEGPGAIYWDFGTAITNGGHGVALFRSSNLLDTITFDVNAEIADHHPGAAVTCGKICFASSADDWFHSDLVLIWGGNPLYTQIPNAHFLTEARYHGTEVVAIAPDFNASAIHTDHWVPVKIGTDAALGLSLAQVIVEENLHDKAFIREQTDLPLLVRSDNRHFLRARDMESGGAEDTFYVYDRKARKVVEVPRKSLDLGGIEPALDGEFSVQTLTGKVRVKPVFALLRERLQEYTPDKATAITGTPPDMIRDLARRIGRARAATFMTQSNFSKFYHGLEMERVQILVLTLCGHIGKKGAGITGFPWLSIEASEAAGVAPATSLKLGMASLGASMAGPWMKAKWRGDTTEMFLYEQARKEYSKGAFISSVLFFHRFGGLAPLTGSSKRWDPHLKRELQEYMDEAVRKKWQIMPKTAPKIFFEVGGNVLRRLRGYDRLLKGFLPKLDLFVTVDWRMSNTALHSDYVLPAAAWYERDDITWATPIAPFAQATTEAAKPYAESKPDWVFHCLLMKRIQERAKARDEVTYRDRAGEERRLDDVYDRFTFGNRYTEDDPSKFLSALLEVNTNLKGVTWEKLKKDGAARFTSLGMSPVNIGNATDIKPDDTITANTWHTDKKMPWPTLTRRVQFYIDHELFLELGEELPVHKDNPAIGGNYPLRMTGGHTRWSIHSMWRDNATLQRLQRGVPTMVINTVDADERGIHDGDRIRAWNDIGSFEIQAKISRTLRPGQVVVYHAWEPYQFSKHQSHQVATPTPLNPLQLAGGYGHIRPMMIWGEPGLNDRGTRVDIEKLGAAAA